MPAKDMPYNTTQQAPKSIKGQEITFSVKGFEVNHIFHGNAIIITMSIAGFEVRRILVNTRSFHGIFFSMPLIMDINEKT